EALIPAPPAAVRVPTSPAAAELARLERKQTADRLATEFALAVIRLDAGRHAESEPLLRGLVANRAKLVAEEPGNFDYRLQVADARIALGRALIATGRSEEGLAEVRQGLAFHAVLAPCNLQANPRRLRLAFVAHLVEVGIALLKAGRPGEGMP